MKTNINFLHYKPSSNYLDEIEITYKNKDYLIFFDKKSIRKDYDVYDFQNSENLIRSYSSLDIDSIIVYNFYYDGDDEFPIYDIIDNDELDSDLREEIREEIEKYFHKENIENLRWTK